MNTTVGLVAAAIGVGLGLGLAFVIRRFRTRRAEKKRAATPVIYASRQDARRAARERDKKQNAARGR